MLFGFGNQLQFHSRCFVNLNIVFGRLRIRINHSFFAYFHLHNFFAFVRMSLITQIFESKRRFSR